MTDRERMLVSKYNRIVFRTEEDAEEYYNERPDTRRARRGKEVLESSEEFEFGEHGATGVRPVGIPSKYWPLYINSEPAGHCFPDEEWVPPYRQRDGKYVQGFCRRRK